MADRRLTIVLRNLTLGGAQREALRLARELPRVDAAWVVQVLILEPDASTRQDLDDLDVSYLDATPGTAGFGRALNPWRLARRLGALRRALAAGSPDCVLAYVATTNVTCILASIWPRRAPWRLVVSERNDPARQRLRAPWQFLRRRLYGRADHIVANTRHAIEAMHGWVSPERLSYIPNAVAGGEPDGVSARQSEILVVGRLHRQKGVDILLTALALLSERFSGWRLRVVGVGAEQAALQALAASLRVDDRIDWEGEMLDVGAAYRRAGVFVLPSRYEGMPNVVLEAMAEGLPVIVSDAADGALELVADRRTGRVFTSENPQSLCAVLTDVLADETGRGEYARAARARLAEHAPEKIAASWSSVLSLESAEI